MVTLHFDGLSSYSKKGVSAFDKEKLVLLLLTFISLVLSTNSYAQPEGSLQMKLYVIETIVIPGQESKLIENLPEHLTHQVDLEKRGIMFGAGPISNTEGVIDDLPTKGMIIIRAGSLDEAKEIADADPMHKNGIRSYSIRQWSLNEGTFNVRVNFSDNSVEFK